MLIRGLSLTQPWASLVAIGAKQWETRSWDTAFRCHVAIQASKKYPKWCRELEYEEPFLSALKRGMGERAHALPLGAVVALAVITDCTRTESLRSVITRRARADPSANARPYFRDRSRAWLTLRRSTANCSR